MFFLPPFYFLFPCHFGAAHAALGAFDENINEGAPVLSSKPLIARLLQEGSDTVFQSSARSGQQDTNGSLDAGDSWREEGCRREARRFFRRRRVAVGQSQEDARH